MKVYIVISAEVDEIITAFKTRERAEDFCNHQNEKFPAYLYFVMTLEVND